MRKICAMLPSRMRPHLMSVALEHWQKNSVASDIYFAFQDTDPKLQENIRILNNKYPYITVGNIGLTAKVNAIHSHVTTTLNLEYDAFVVLNDDQVIHTPGWDNILLDTLDQLEKEHGHRHWILYWRDDIQNERLASGFLTKETLRITKSFFPVGYMRHLYVDNYIMYIGRECNILKYLHHVHLEHRHFTTGKTPNDANYQETNSGDRYYQDSQAFNRWVTEHGRNIVDRIKTEINNKRR